MTSFRVVHSAAEDWAQAAKICADGLSHPPGAYNLGFIYVTDLLAGDLTSILTYLRQKTGIEHWVGSVGIGICAMAGDEEYGSAEYFERSAIAVMAMELGENAFHILPLIENEVDDLPGESRDWIRKTGARFGVVHADPSNSIVPTLVDDLATEVSGFLVGGLTSSQGENAQVCDRVTEGGLSGVMFAPGMEIVTGLSQGCTPISQSHLISDCIDNIIIGLDGRPALDVFVEDIGEELGEDLEQVAGLIHAALPIEGSDTGDYLVRSLVGIDPERGWLAIGEQVDCGQRLMFVRRDPLSAETDMRNRLQNLKDRLGKPPRAALYFSCVGRGASMFGSEGRELSLIEDVIGEVPLVGFFGNGEISHNRLYGYTGVLTLIA
ncbi:MAG: FIST C-terminal domain-containing protein [Rhodospirillaceae bacterium]|nr:FIST C-terminal domain-containing protein [Rhodospirillaceae bacterium]